MTRHARNSTAGSVYTYHEKKKDQRESGFGTERQRLAKDSITSFGKIHFNSFNSNKLIFRFRLLQLDTSACENPCSDSRWLSFR